MSFIDIPNGGRLALSELPLLPLEEFRRVLLEAVKAGARPASFFSSRPGPGGQLIALLADDRGRRLRLCRGDASAAASYQALTVEAPAFHLFEREVWEETGLVPDCHPWLKPVRYGRERHDQTQLMTGYPFFLMQGEYVHEVAVGPIHAGIIEPGHFRFQCHGETVHHLEIQLGYQHRGAERLLASGHDHRRLKPALAESLAGDSVIAQAWSYARTVEALSGARISDKAEVLRALGLELERAAVHIGDLAALCNDVAYQLGSAVFGATRTLVINTSLAVCGNRLGRGWIRPGGTTAELDERLKPEIRKTLKKVMRDVKLMSETMFASPSVMERFESTGVVARADALAIGLVGPPARACGLPLDVRRDHPWGWYAAAPFEPVTAETGDVYARAWLRSAECQESLSLALKLLDRLPADNPPPDELGPFAPDSIAVSLVEGWRGELVHAALTGPDGAIARYKITDPSFHNWFALALAVRGNGISDFPLCNKSFNLSYAGVDL